MAVTTYLSNVKRSNATRHFLITRESDGALIAQSRSLWVFINLETNSIARLPQVMFDAFATHIAAE